MSENLNICLVNDSFPPEIDGVANAVTNYADIITREHGRCTVVTPDNPKADDSVYDLRGRRVASAAQLSSLRKGIYIVNGRKQIVK